MIDCWVRVDLWPVVCQSLVGVKGARDQDRCTSKVELTAVSSRLHVEQTTWSSLSSALGNTELPLTKMEKTGIGTDLGGQIQLNLASLKLRSLVGTQGECGAGERDLRGTGMLDSHKNHGIKPMGTNKIS